MVYATYRIPIKNLGIRIVITGPKRTLNYQPFRESNSSITLLRNFILKYFSNIDSSSSQTSVVETLYNSISKVLMCPNCHSVKIWTVPNYNSLKPRKPISQLEKLYISIE